MNSEERKKANAEMREIGQWLVSESDRIYKGLIDKYGDDLIIDGNKSAYEQMHKEFVRRMDAVKEKYKF